MSEIQYYGSSHATSNPFYGELVKIWTNHNSLRKDGENVGIKYPFFYNLSLEEARDVNSKSFMWPVRLRLSGDSYPIYEHWMEAHNAIQFRKIINSIEDEKTTVMVFRLPLTSSKTYAFASIDGCHLVLGDGRVIPISCDMDQFFKSGNLKKEYTYCIKRTAAGYFVDSIIPTDNEFLKSMLGRPIAEANSESFECFREGFLTGYHNHIKTNGISQRLAFMSDFRISNDLNAAYNQGVLFGGIYLERVNELISTGILNLESEEEKIRTIVQLQQSKLESWKDLSKIYNAIVNRDLSFDYSEAFESTGWSLYSANYICDFAERVSTCFQTYEIPENSFKYKSHCHLLNLDVGDEFNLEQDFGFERGQFRIINEYANDDSRYKIRFQGHKVYRNTIAITSKGNKYHIHEGSSTKIETTFAVNGSGYKDLSKLTYDQPSDAGTKATYALVKIKGDNIVSVENEELIVCSLETLIKYCKDFV